MGNRYICKQTFENWCLENNRHNILDLWDYEKNDFLPSEIPYGTKRKCYFKCCNGIHDSEPRRISTITSGNNYMMTCKKCNNGMFGKTLEDLKGKTFGDLTVIEHDIKRSAESKNTYWICKCSCGDVLSVLAQSLRSGQKTSCGKSGSHKTKEDPLKVADLRSTAEYNKYRAGVIAKDNCRCIITGKITEHPEVHHIYPFALYPTKRFSVNCGVCISMEYHSTNFPESFHSIYGVHNNTPEQFQDYVNMKRKELGIEELFDVYEYMNLNNADCLKVNGTIQM